MTTEEIVSEIESKCQSLLDNLTELFDDGNIDDLTNEYIKKLRNLNDALCDHLDID